MGVNIDDEYSKIILNIIDKKCPSIRKPQYTNEYYLENIIYVLRDLVSWESLQLLYPNKHKYHYKTIQDKFLEWSKLNIFELAFNKLLKKYKFNKINSKSTLNLLIDASFIYNKNGNECIAYGESKKKKVTKISVTSIGKEVINVDFFPGNVHDTKTIQTSIDNIKSKTSYRRINMIADKGYISTKINMDKFMESKVKLITPKRKNQKKSTTKLEKKYLKTRYQVENGIESLKSFNRICIRRDKLIHTYKSFVFLALIIKFKK